MKSAARFLRVTLPGPPKRPGWRIKCQVCSRVDDVVEGSGAVAMREAEIAARFEQRGWKVGRGTHHTCPVCLRPPPPRIKSTAIVDAFGELAAPVVTVKKPEPAPMAAKPPPVASREDNRRIHEAIEHGWREDLDCYASTLSDRSIAEGLNVPRAWVAAVREQFFGPDENTAIREGGRQLGELILRAAALEASGLKLAEDAEALRREADALKRKLGA